MKVCYLPSDLDAPGFYRCLSPGRLLAEHGVEVFMPPREVVPFKDGYRIKFEMGELPRAADVYVLQQRKERYWRDEGVGRLRRYGIAVCADVDDNYVNLPTYNPAFLGTHPYRMDTGVVRNRAQRRQDRSLFGGKMPPPNKSNSLHLLEQLKCVDMVTVSTPFLADVYSRYNGTIRVVRNHIDWDVFRDVEPQYNVRRDKVRVGWLGAFRYREADLRVLQRVLPRFLKDHPEVDFVTNTEAAHNYLGIPEGQRVTVGEYPFQPIEDGVMSADLPVGRMTAVCDIGLVPLAMNDLNRGKSHLKGLEYNAAGIPFIASPTESYTGYWYHRGQNGFIAETEDDWYHYMEALVQDDRRRRTMGRQGRILAERDSIQHKWTEWMDVYNELVGDDHVKLARLAVPMGAIQKPTELSRLLRLIHDRQPRTIVEIGSATGGCFWAFAQEAPDDALLISMDIPAGSPLDVRDGHDVYGLRDRDRFGQLVRAQQQLRLIDMDTHTGAAYAALVSALDGRQIDFLFIDGDHRYEGVKQDWEMYRPLVAPGGIIAFHDIEDHTGDKRVGVNRFWKELRKRETVEEFYGAETWGFKPWGGIGVVHA